MKNGAPIIPVARISLSDNLSKSGNNTSSSPNLSKLAK